MAGKQEAQEEDPARPPPRAPKTVSSFFGECLHPSASGRAGRPHPVGGLSPVSWLHGPVGAPGRGTHSFLTSFLAPRKPATKREGKEEGPGAPRQEEAKG